MRAREEGGSEFQAAARERVLRWAFLALVALAPLWYASTGAIAQAGNALAVALLAAAVLAIAPRRAPFGNMPQHVALILSAVFAAVVAWSLLQALPAPGNLPHHPLWDRAAATLREPIDQSLSLDRQATLTDLARHLTVATVFALALRLAHSGEGARSIVQATVAAGTLYALYALADLLFDWRMVLYTPKNPYTIARYGNYASGPFLNSTHFAVYCGIALIAACALMARGLARLADSAPRSLKWRIAIGLRELAVPGCLMAGALLVLALGIVTSTSRAASFTVLAGLLALFALLALRSRRLVLSGAAMLATLGVFVLLIDSLAGIAAERSGTLARALDSRLAVYRLAVDAIRDAPITGYGLGAFDRAFPLYRDATVGIGGVWHTAHNTYLELAVTLGIPAAALLIGSVAFLGAACAAGAVRRRQHMVAPLAAAGATVALGLHSLIDFPLQTDAVAIAYAALLGAGCAQAWPSGVRARAATRSRREPRGEHTFALGGVTARSARSSLRSSAPAVPHNRICGASRPRA